MTDLTIHDALERLTREHHVTVKTDDGPKITTEDSLIQQLRDAMFGGNDRGAAASNKTKLPLNAPAMDLFQLIDRQAAEVWSAVTGQVPSIDRLELLIVEWAAAVNESTLVVYSTPETLTSDDDRDHVIWVRNETAPGRLLNRWVTQIVELFDPPRTAEIQAPCIVCGEWYVWRQKDGENIRTTALVFIRDRETDTTTEARCLGCGESWWPYQFEYLARAMGQSEQANPRTTVTEEER